MKLRMQSNSIRLRLKQHEVQQLLRTGRVEERITFGGEGDGAFTYVLECSQGLAEPHAVLTEGGILVQIPAKVASRWASGDDVAIDALQGDLQVLIEKDFACLNGTDEQNADTFPNPLAGTKC
jgi:hypothetical protein